MFSTPRFLSAAYSYCAVRKFLPCEVKLLFDVLLSEEEKKLRDEVRAFVRDRSIALSFSKWTARRRSTPLNS